MPAPAPSLLPIERSMRSAERPRRAFKPPEAVPESSSFFSRSTILVGLGAVAGGGGGVYGAEEEPPKHIYVLLVMVVNEDRNILLLKLLSQQLDDTSSSCVHPNFAVSVKDAGAAVRVTKVKFLQ